MRNMFFLFGALLLVDGVLGVEKVNMTVMEGDSVTLNPQTEIPENETTEWWFGELIIAKINKAAGNFNTSKGDNVGFKGRLKLDHQTGSLTITNTRTNHTGLYKLKINSRTGTSETFRVTVSASGLSSGAIAGIVVGVLLVVFAVAGVVSYYCRKNSKQKSLTNDAENYETIFPLENGTNDPLNGEEENDKTGHQ